MHFFPVPFEFAKTKEHKTGLSTRKQDSCLGLVLLITIALVELKSAHGARFGRMHKNHLVLVRLYMSLYLYNRQDHKYIL